jgi:hypothetical protein
MEAGDPAWMNLPIALPHPSEASWSVGQPGLWLMGVLLALGLSQAPLPENKPANAQVQPLVRFQDASHNWLMVVDPATHELVVYDANNGRPLHRLGADDGLAEVTAISRKDSLLYVTGNPDEAMQVLRLPQLQTVALNER